MRLRRNAARLAEVAAILARHGWAPALRLVGLSRFAPGDTPPDDKTKRRADILPPATLRQLLTELGPTYVKVGQLLSTRPDLIPRSYVEELSKLQDAGPAIPPEEVEELLREELEDVNEVFTEFDFEPKAAASLGQVHHARIAGLGDVVVKVQRPGARDVVETDLEILFHFAQTAQAAVERLQRMGIVEVIENLAGMLRCELDYACEGRNADRLREALPPGARVRVPRVHWEYCTRRVLVMERLHGCKITDVETQRAWGIAPEETAKKLAEAIFHQIFIDGVFHGDPHPGNVIVDQDGSLGFVDFGLIGHLDTVTREGLLEMLVAIHRGDGEVFADRLLALCTSSEHVDRGAFTRDAESIVREFVTTPPNNIRVGHSLRQSLILALRHGLALPPVVPLLVRVLVAFEGVCKHLDPDFEILDHVAGMVFKAAYKRLQPRNLGVSALLAGADALDLLFRSPRLLSQFLSKAASGRMTLSLEHGGLVDFGDQLNKIANRIAYAMIVAACIVGSSLLVRANAGPSIGGLPVVALVAWFLAFVLGIDLLWSIIRTGRLR